LYGPRYDTHAQPARCKLIPQWFSQPIKLKASAFTNGDKIADQI